MAACQNSIPEFNGARAYDVLLRQCEFGPRNPGSEGYRQCKRYLIETLQSLADTVMTQKFSYTEKKHGNTFQLENIIARFNPDRKHRLLIGAHWDTRPWADWDPHPDQREQPIPGANDGASGVAVLIELATLLHKHRPEIGVTLILFDGEDLGVAGINDSYAQGSQYFSRNLPIPRPDQAIVLDMIGDADLNIPIERNSYHFAPTLVKDLWRLAETLNLPAFEARLDRTIYDDHVPLWEYAGIPAVDFIDFDYPRPGANYWHTHDDVPGNCSAESLDQVGTLLTHYIWSQRND